MPNSLVPYFSRTYNPQFGEPVYHTALEWHHDAVLYGAEIENGCEVLKDLTTKQNRLVLVNSYKLYAYRLKYLACAHQKE